MIRKQSNKPSLFDLGGDVRACSLCDVFINFAPGWDTVLESVPIKVVIISPSEDLRTLDVTELRLSFEQAADIANRLLLLIGESDKH
jgi:hypothetical protein